MRYLNLFALNGQIRSKLRFEMIEIYDKIIIGQGKSKLMEVTSMFDLITRNKRNNYSVLDLMNDFFSTDVMTSTQGFKVDVSENDKEYLLEAELPGFDKKDISVELKNNYLTISASRDCEKEEKEKNFIRRERCYGEFSRSFYAKGVKQEDINAKYENGVLLVKLPKKDKEEAPSTTIEIK